MTRPLALEAFDAPDPADAADGPRFSGAEVLDFPAPPPDLVAGDAAPVPEAAAGDYQSDDFARGYRAGWDDCEAQAREARQAVGAELARNLQELGFTFHEARAHVLAALHPLLSAILTKLLPRLVTDSLGPAILEELAALAATAADAPVTVLVAPENLDAVDTYLQGVPALPHRLVAEETLTAGQVFFRLGTQERQLDLGEVTERIAARLAAFADQNRRMLSHG